MKFRTAGDIKWKDLQTSPPHCAFQRLVGGPFASVLLSHHLLSLPARTPSPLNPKESPFFPSLLRIHCGFAPCQRQASSSPQEMSQPILVPWAPSQMPLSLSVCSLFSRSFSQLSQLRYFQERNNFFLLLISFCLTQKAARKRQISPFWPSTLFSWNIL